MTKITRRTAFALGGAALAAPAIGRADTALPDKTLKILVAFRRAAARTSWQGSSPRR